MVRVTVQVTLKWNVLFLHICERRYSRVLLPTSHHFKRYASIVYVLRGFVLPVVSQQDGNSDFFILVQHILLVQLNLAIFAQFTPEKGQNIIAKIGTTWKFLFRAASGLALWSGENGLEAHALLSEAPVPGEFGRPKRELFHRHGHCRRVGPGVVPMWLSHGRVAWPVKCRVNNTFFHGTDSDFL